MYTICDKCTAEIPTDEANDGDEFGYGMLCNECYAELYSERKDREDAEDADL